MEKKPFYFLIALLMILGACSGVKHLDEGDTLYIGMLPSKLDKKAGSEPFKIDYYGTKLSNVYFKILAYPNGSLFGYPIKSPLPFRLTTYNIFYTNREKGFKKWMMDNFGQEPKTIEDINPKLRVAQVENALFNFGHFDAEGTYNLRYLKDKRNKKRALLKYHFKVGRAYTYRNFIIKNLELNNELITELKFYRQNLSKLKAGNDFNVEELESDKLNLWQYLHNKGYYYLNRSDIILAADTTVGNRQVDLRYQFTSEALMAGTRKVSVAEIELTVDSVDIDTDKNKIKLPYKEKIKPSILESSVAIETGKEYSYSSQKKTINNLSELNVFKSPRVTYTPMQGDSSKLIAKVMMETMDPYSFSFDGNIVIGNSGFVGPYVKVEIGKKNLFGGAENFTFGVEGTYQFPTGIYRELLPGLYSFGFYSKLSSPAFKGPLTPIMRNLDNVPKRSYNFRFEDIVWRDFFAIAQYKGSYEFDWQTTKRLTHNIEIANFELYTFRSLFPDQDLGLDSLERVVLGGGYNLDINRINFKKKNSFSWNMDIETSGNMASLVAGLRGSKFELQSSQFIKAQSIFKYYRKLNNNGSQLVFRSIIGIARAYGFSETVPFPKQFFIGGANSLRPVTPRVVGPGRYFNFDSSITNQVGDIKLETNIEYRFRVGYRLYGALWTDIGNIWLWEDDPERPGSGIRIDNILNDSYITSGTGLRLDLDFIIARLDYGVLINFPFLPEGFKRVWQFKEFAGGFVFGIGYPF